MPQAKPLKKKTDREEVEEILRGKFPHGHPDFLPTTLDEIQLHSDKNHDYAAGGDPLGNFDRVAAILSMYPGFPYDKPVGVAITYALKQVDAILWGLSQGIEHKVEGLKGRFQDVSVYFKLANIIHRRGE